MSDIAYAHDAVAAAVAQVTAARIEREAAAEATRLAALEPELTTGSVPETMVDDEPDRVVVALPFDLVYSAAQTRHEPSRRELCKKAASVAAAHDLPVPFFANLIWQESGFQSDVVSSAGAQGIAQFMPETATAYGLEDPFDPVPALAASGKLLSDLRAQFGNLGLAAAAYNAGPRRVSDWMRRRGRLPGETRKYVKIITGRPAEHWVKPQDAAAGELMPPRAPCLEAALALESQAKAQQLEMVSARKVTTVGSATASVASRRTVSSRGPRTKRVAIAAGAAKPGVRTPHRVRHKSSDTRRHRRPAGTSRLVRSQKKTHVAKRVAKPSIGRKVKLATAR